MDTHTTPAGAGSTAAADMAARPAAGSRKRQRDTTGGQTTAGGGTNARASGAGGGASPAVRDSSSRPLPRPLKLRRQRSPSARAGGGQDDGAGGGGGGGRGTRSGMPSPRPGARGGRGGRGRGRKPCRSPRTPRDGRQQDGRWPASAPRSRSSTTLRDGSMRGSRGGRGRWGSRTPGVRRRDARGGPRPRRLRVQVADDTGSRLPDPASAGGSDGTRPGDGGDGSASASGGRSAGGDPASGGRMPPSGRKSPRPRSKSPRSKSPRTAGPRSPRATGPRSPRAWRRRRRTSSAGSPEHSGGRGAGGGGGEGSGGVSAATKSKAPAEPRRRSTKKRPRFVHGNYDQYYGYRVGGPGGKRNNDTTVWRDPRLDVFDPAWFRGKACLDIGCNAGYITASIAESCGCASMLGVDIDPRLVAKARRLLRDKARRSRLDKQLAAAVALNSKRGDATAASTDQEGDGNSGCAPPAPAPLVRHDGTAFPVSLPVTHGSRVKLQPPPPSKVSMAEFPYNVTFRQADFVGTEHNGGPYGAIMCLSVTKWVHLNQGDDGLMALFRKIHGLLEPGGVLVLEPQPWRSYKKKARRLTPEIAATFKTLKLRPDDFPRLLTEDVGFASVRQLPTPSNATQGFDRPLYLCTKAE